MSKKNKANAINTVGGFHVLMAFVNDTGEIVSNVTGEKADGSISNLLKDGVISELGFFIPSDINLMLETIKNTDVRANGNSKKPSKVTSWIENGVYIIGCYAPTLFKSVKASKSSSTTTE